MIGSDVSAGLFVDMVESGRSERKKGQMAEYVLSTDRKLTNRTCEQCRDHSSVTLQLTLRL